MSSLSAAKDLLDWTVAYEADQISQISPNTMAFAPGWEPTVQVPSLTVGMTTLLTQFRAAKDLPSADGSVSTAFIRSFASLRMTSL
jgi:hypothetical protein